MCSGFSILVSNQVAVDQGEHSVIDYLATVYPRDYFQLVTEQRQNVSVAVPDAVLWLHQQVAVLAVQAVKAKPLFDLPSVDVLSSAPLPAVKCFQSTTTTSPRRRALSQLLEYPGPSIADFELLMDREDVDIGGADMFGYLALHKLASWNAVEHLEVLVKRLHSSALRVKCGPDMQTCSMSCKLGVTCSIRGDAHSTSIHKSIFRFSHHKDLSSASSIFHKQAWTIQMLIYKELKELHTFAEILVSARRSND